MIIVDQLINIIKSSHKIVIFSGAGLSVSSGLDDYRTSQETYKGNDFQYLLSNICLNESPVLFYEYLEFRFINNLNQQNKLGYAYQWIKKQEQSGKLLGCVTQNIDSLHKKANIQNVIDIHGNLNNFYCQNCSLEYLYGEFNTRSPYCKCGGIIRPNVVLYGENINDSSLKNAATLIYSSDCLLILGTSLLVNPAAELIQCFQGKHMVIINKTATPYDPFADLVINADIDTTFEDFDRYSKSIKHRLKNIFKFSNYV